MREPRDTPGFCQGSHFKIGWRGPYASLMEFRKELRVSKDGYRTQFKGGLGYGALVAPERI